MRYYDKENKRIISILDASSPSYWDDHWEGKRVKNESLKFASETYVTRETKKFVGIHDGWVFEGGCGDGKHVAALTYKGYQCVGLDFAPRTLETFKEEMPQVNLLLGDVQQLCLSEGSVICYWSLGVIEHFWDGYNSIGKEMMRIVKPKGYLFLVFPYMSPLRKFKAKLGFYRDWLPGIPKKSFYQFTLEHRQVIQNFREFGFDPVKIKPLDGIKGLKSEFFLFQTGLQRLYDYRGKSLIIRGFRLCISQVLSIVAGHIMLLVLRRRGKC